MDKKMEEHLKCPICFEIPENEVYQCRNGHQICSGCCNDKLTLCPTCRLKYDNPKIRNRAMEDVLNALEFDCEFKGKGCVQKMHRSMLAGHFLECKFRPFPFCKLIGFKMCACDASNQIPKLTLIHLQQIHKIPVRQQAHDEVVVCHAKFVGDLIPPRGERRRAARMTTTKLWGPVLIKLENDDFGPTFMLIGVVNGGSISWLCLYMSDSQEEASKFQVELSISNVFGIGEESALKWNVGCFTFKRLEDLVKKPPVSLPLDFFKHHVGDHLLDNGSLMIKVGITKKTDKKVFETVGDPVKVYFR